MEERDLTGNHENERLQDEWEASSEASHFRMKRGKPADNHNRSRKKLSKSKKRRRRVVQDNPHTRREFVAKCKQYGWRCAYCGTALTPETATRDHIVPVSEGGHHSIDNILPCCEPCNQAKANMNLSDFLDTLHTIGK